MKQLTKADFFGATWPAPVRVEMPDLAGEVYVRVLSVGELEELAAAGTKQGENGPEQVFAGQRGRMIAACACDKDGVRIFADDDWMEIGRRPVPMIEPVFDAALAANGQGKRAKEDARKNSSPAPA